MKVPQEKTTLCHLPFFVKLLQFKWVCIYFLLYWLRKANTFIRENNSGRERYCV